MKHKARASKKQKALHSSAQKDLERPERNLFLRHQNWILGLALIVGVIFAYQPVWHAGFIWDDDSYVTGNATLHTLNGLWRIWFEPGATAQYYPLTFTGFWLEYHLWGLNPLGYHLINVLLHGIGAVLLWKILTRLNLPCAWLAAAIFALHPVEVESAAWITERKNVLSGVCYFAAALAYLRFAELQNLGKADRHCWRYYFCALVLFVAGLLSKTVICSLPAALLLVTWWKKGRMHWKDILPLLPFFIAGIGFSFLTAWMEKHHVGAHGVEWSLTWGQRLLIAGRALWFYADKLIWPVNLTFNYPRWTIETGIWWQWLFPAAAVAVVITLWLARHRIGRGPLVAILFFAGTLVPALGFINVYPMRYSFVADHFQYLASIGLIVLAAAGMTMALRKHTFFKAIVSTALLLTLAVLTWRQCQMYRDEETLWRVTIQKNPRAFIAYNNLGYILQQKGDVAEAIADYHKSLDATENEEAYDNLGNAFMQTREFQSAIAQYQKALELEPKDSKTFNNLGNAFSRIGQLDKSVIAYQKALELYPKNADAHNGLGVALVAEGRLDEAILHYQKAIELDPANADSRNNLGLALVQKSEPQQAIVQYQKAVELRPGEAIIHYNLGCALLQIHQIAGAAAQFQKTTELKPGFIMACSRWAWILSAAPDASIRNGPKAVELAQRANRLSGGQNPSILFVLASALAECGRFDEAIATGQKALQLATAQNNPSLAGILRTQIKLYQSGSPLRDETLEQKN